jgi:hypothetical protein
MRKDCLAVAVVATALGAMLSIPGMAFGDVSVAAFSVVPSTTAAGGHPEVTITEAFAYTLGSQDTVKSATLHFPPGLLGNPQATNRCPPADFASDHCPSNTQVGMASVGVSVFIFGIPFPLDAPLGGSIYNLVPDHEHPAMLGIVIRPPIGPKVFLKSPISIRSSGDFGLDSPVDDMPNKVLGLRLRTNQVKLTLFGIPDGATEPFMTNPTSCKDATTTLDVVSYKALEKTATGYSRFTPTDCDKLAFSPGIAAVVGGQGGTAAGSRVKFIARVTQPMGQAAQLDTTVTLPAALAPAVNSVSTLCSPDQLAVAACPAAARIGDAEISTPLIPTPVQGPVFVIQRPGQLPGVGVQFGGILPFTFGGSSSVTADGRLQTVFSGRPDMPVTTFTLAIVGGAHGFLAANRDLCTGPNQTVVGSFTGQNGVTSSATANVAVLGCGAQARATLRGLATSHPRLSVTLKQGQMALRAVLIRLPHDLRVRSIRRGVGAVVSAVRLGKRSVRLFRNGMLTLNLQQRGARRVTATLKGGSIVGSERIRARLRKRPTVKLTLAIRTVDISGRRAAFHTTVIGKR